MTQTLRDVKRALKLMRRERWFSILIVGTIALAIGASAVVLSVTDTVILRPLPYPDPDRLVRITVDVSQRNGQLVTVDPSVVDVDSWSSRAQSFARIALWQKTRGITVFVPEPEKASATNVGEGYFDVYGVVPQIGRAITAADRGDTAPPVVLISHEYWQRRFGGNAAVIGQTLRVGDKQATIVGVIPATFFPSNALWLPLRANSLIAAVRGSGVLTVGRLRPKVRRESAAHELTSIALSRGFSQQPQFQVRVRSLLEETSAEYGTTVVLLGVFVFLIILIACVNIAGLLIARGVSREAELAVRVSLGATRTRLVRQLLTEQLVLCALGALGGVIVAGLFLNAFVAMLPMTLPANTTLRLNPRVLAYLAVITTFTGLAFGLPPALTLSGLRGAEMERLKRHRSTPLSRRAAHLIIALEIGLTMMLMAAAGVMIRSFERLVHVDLGFDPTSFVAMDIAPVGPVSTSEVYSRLLDALRPAPGVAAVGATDQLPLAGNSTSSSVRTSQAGDVPVKVRHIVPGYVEAVGMPLLSGRDIRDSDRFGDAISTVLVNAEAARRIFPDTIAIGQRLTYEGHNVEVVGIVGDIRHRGPLRPVDPEVYLPLTPKDFVSTGLGLTIVIRRDRRTPLSDQQLRSVAKAEGPLFVVERIRPGKQIYDELIARHRQRTALIAVMASVALIIAVVGVVSVTSYATAGRGKEIALRMAFGAARHQLLRAAMWDSVAPALIGIMAGLLSALLITRVLRSFLFETAPTDPLSFLTAAITMAIATSIAAWVPSRMAIEAEPAQLLRGE